VETVFCSKYAQKLSCSSLPVVNPIKLPARKEKGHIIALLMHSANPIVLLFILRMALMMKLSPGVDFQFDIPARHFGSVEW
jgi:hypothetical protein